jgi:hypothetical protein
VTLSDTEGVGVTDSEKDRLGVVDGLPTGELDTDGLTD